MEKRKRPRMSLSLDVTYESGNDFLSSFLSNISSDGVFIETPRPLEVNTQLRIRFHVPEMEESLGVEGTVVWVREIEDSLQPGMGIRFEGMDPDDRKRLDRFLAEYRKG